MIECSKSYKIREVQSNIKWRFELKDFAWSDDMVESINQPKD